jgi:hypothetical protein
MPCNISTLLRVILKMKYLLLFIAFLATTCNKPPFVASATPQTTWIDEQTHKDTIITNVNNQRVVVYYAAHQWQQSADTSLAHGYRFIAIFYADSILVKRLNDTTTFYDGPFLLQTNDDYDTLKAQNFLDTAITNSTRTYVLLR